MNKTRERLLYNFLCEYVHPNYGSNTLVSTGQLAGGRLNPPEEFHRQALDRIRGYCSQCMQFLRGHGVEHASIFAKLYNLFEYCLVRGAKVNNVFAIRASMPDGDGKSKETAYFFRKARTPGEAMDLSCAFLAREGYTIRSRQNDGIGNGVAYDLYTTDRGAVWFKIPMIQI